jgi:hypothetical protein
MHRAMLTLTPNVVPTNCMRACTAVVTEISYNFETADPYRGLIEFISEADWLKELKALYHDLLNEYGEMRDVARDAEAGVAWAKIHAVYPKKTKDDLTRTNPEKLVKENNVQSVLGTTQVVEDDNSWRFYKELQKYVDSEEKKEDSEKTMESWPLIRVVKIFTKSEVLKTGACIVDLPGVHDANAARAAVADGYMQNCTGLWIVAPITRAVDDKSAHKLMGEGFRRQLLMDGGFSSISFICSKADDISVSEAALSLHLDDEFGPQMEEVEKWEAEIEEKKEKLDDLEETRADMQKGLEQSDDYLTAWEDAQDAVGEGKTAYARKLKKKEDGDDEDEAPSKKRKRGLASAAKGKKKAKKGKKKEDDEMDGFIVDSDEEEEVDAIEISDDEDKEDNKEKEEEEEDKGEPVTVDEIKVQKRELWKTKSEIIAQINSLKAEIGELKESKKKLEDTIAVRCIDERNKYSTSAIQADFAAGLRELDLEAAEERDGDNFNPDVEIRDYDEVANSLPVFCVSSRGYQKLKGRLKKDGDPPVFSQIEQ